MLKSGIFYTNVPALSTLWLIEREAYDNLGGMPSVARKVIPEHYFANHLHSDKKYAFVRTNDYLHVSTAKSLREQLATSNRTLYPGLHRRMEWVAVVCVAIAVLLLAPFVAVFSSLMNGDMLRSVIYLICIGCLTLSHLLVTTYTNPVLWPLAIINFPYLAMQEIVLYARSMYAYEFGEVVWKDRNICLPVLQVIPRLPSADEK
jgi:hypothetical protein